MRKLCPHTTFDLFEMCLNTLRVEQTKTRYLTCRKKSRLKKKSTQINMRDRFANADWHRLIPHPANCRTNAKNKKENQKKRHPNLPYLRANRFLRLMLLYLAFVPFDKNYPHSFTPVRPFTLYSGSGQSWLIRHPTLLLLLLIPSDIRV